jgi:predicted nucleotidyltransferase component of viral defense system
VRFALDDLQREAAVTGFSGDMLEKASRLLGLLDAIRSHPYLGTRVALKGGTALNLFVLDLPRLSIDIDLNYTGALRREVMIAERPKIDQAIHAVCAREELGVRRVPDEHAGGKWRLTYTSAAGGSGNLELDMNFLLRTPLWPAKPLDSRPLGSFRASRVPVLDIHELAGGKLAALLSRRTSRDLFDACQLLRRSDLDVTKLPSPSWCTAPQTGGTGDRSRSRTCKGRRRSCNAVCCRRCVALCCRLAGPRPSCGWRSW